MHACHYFRARDEVGATEGLIAPVACFLSQYYVTVEFNKLNQHADTHFLDDLSGITDHVVTISISVVRALKTAIRDDALVRNALEPFLDGNDTASATAVCPDVAVLFARGAKEPGKSMSRNVGFLVGPPLFQALETYINGTSPLAIQGVEYGRLSRADAGARVAAFAAATTARCPGSGIAMAGYSFGAKVVRSALARGNSTVRSVVLFGDPEEGAPVEGVDSRFVKTFCHEGDLVCQRTSPPATTGAGDDDGVARGEGQDGEFPSSKKSVVGPHLDYSLDAPAAAMFVMQRSGLGVASDDAMDEGMAGTVVGMVQQIMKNANGGIDSRRRLTR
ncbi:cutinase [Verticillium dahliae]|nr:Ribosomal protein L6 [Verticillium dahliae VDG2]